MPISLKISHGFGDAAGRVTPHSKVAPPGTISGWPRADRGAADFQTRCRPDANTEQHEKEESNET